MNLLEHCIDEIFNENPEKYEDWTPEEIASRKKEIYSNAQLKIKKENETAERLVKEFFSGKRWECVKL